MERRGQATDRHNRTWTAVVVSEDEAEEADFQFWYEGLSPEERVSAVQDCLLSALKARESVKSRDYEEFIESLNRIGARYLIVGAHAVAFHARRVPQGPRSLDRADP